MNITIENVLLVGSLLLLISILAGKTSYKFGVPTLLLFLVIGMLAGSDGFVGIQFDNPKIAQFIGVVSLNFILFSGGLDTNWKAVRPIIKEGIVLSTVGVFLTASLVGGFVYFLTDFTIYESLLLGAIVSSTDAAAVFSILRSKNLSLKWNLRPVLELESGSNDPMAYVLTIAFLTLVTHPESSIFALIFLFLKQMLIGALLGFGFGKLSKIIINTIRLDFEGLYPVLVIALMFITFSFTDFVGGNGFLAIYICAVYLGNQDLIHKNTIYKVFDGFAWLVQIVLFLTLGLLVFPTKIMPVIGIGLGISVFMILVARPISVLVSLLPFKMEFTRRAYISWVGLRGAAPIVFATYPLIAGIEKAEMIFNIVFFISVTSVLFQGTTIALFAKWLNVIEDGKENTDLPEKLTLDLPKTKLAEILIEASDYAVNKRIVDLHFPVNAFIVMIHREGTYLRPGGSSELLANDKLTVITDTPEHLIEVHDCIKHGVIE